MSYLNTKQALITQLIGNLPAGLNVADVAFENNNFDPQGKSLWLSCYFIPATEETTGKNGNDNDEQRGVFQVSVFVSLNSVDYDNAQLQAVDQLKTAFKFNTEMVYNTQTVTALESSINNGSENEAWFKRDISINYLTISTR